MFSQLSHANIGASRLVSTVVQTEYFEMALKHYSQRLIKCAQASDYLIKQRGIAAALVRSFDIGYCDRTLPKALPHYESFEGALVRGTLQRFGLFKPNGRERFRGAITIPIKDEKGTVVDVYGRRIGAFQRQGVSLRLSMRPHPLSLFNAEALVTNRQIILCSSPLEALTLLTMGFSNVVSLLGLELITASFFEQMKVNGIEHVVVAISDSQKGRACKKIVRQMLKSLGISYSELSLLANDDINSLFLTLGFEKAQLRFGELRDEMGKKCH